MFNSLSAFDLSFAGTLLIGLSLIAAAYTMVLGFGAARGRSDLALPARYGAFATAALIATTVFVLACAFQLHAFEIRYVFRYSDRSMPWWYLLAALWGGQDGSILWWTFLLCIYFVSALIWNRKRFPHLEPWFITVVTSVIAFFLVLMIFAANPFELLLRSTPADGEGMNPLLQNYWMMIHPPSLYLGFVGWTIPFGFAAAALLSGAMDNRWITASRVWSMVAWGFLSLGLLLGCLWSYEELGWGGYWAWDPVENASFMPWLVGTAFLHSVMIQERYQMMKIWNVFLIFLTFFLTIFGTFLTRSGLIASVHSFARSDIGLYFAGYLVVLVIALGALLYWRLPMLKSENQLQSLLSREFAFLLNNWVLLAIMLFVLVSTTFPLLSEWARGETLTVGPSFYNQWIVPFGILLLFLTGFGPLVSWRKATQSNLWRALLVPIAVTGLVMLAHILIGPRFGFPAIVKVDPLYDTHVGSALAKARSVAPLIFFGLCAFVLTSCLQEYVRGVRVRMQSKGEGLGRALINLVARAQRRYGGYLIHIGIAVMCIGFTGAAYDHEKEATLSPGQTLQIKDYTLRYEHPKMERDPNKMMAFANVSLLDSAGNPQETLRPAKFIYRTHPNMPTTEVAIRSRAKSDLYLIVSTIDPQSKQATFRVIVRPLVAWIWIGGLLVLAGTIVAIWPSAISIIGRGSRAAAATAILLALLSPAAPLQAQDSSSSHAGTVIMHNDEERSLFGKLLCQCGSCARLALDVCGCDWAEHKRAEIREQLAAGQSSPHIVAAYREKYGSAALATPPDQGFSRLIWVVPAIGLLLGVALVWRRGKGWVRSPRSADSSSNTDIADDNYESRVDQLIKDRERDA